METIRYVEDDWSLIDGLEYTLEASGYSVDNARTVKQALALFNSKSYHLLLLDVTLPDGSGFEICKEVRKSSSVPVIFLTASDQERIYTFTPQNGVLLRNNPISAPIRKPGRGGYYIATASRFFWVQNYTDLIK